MKKISKQALDKTISEIIFLKAQKKEIEALLDERIASIESMYKKADNEKEVISGDAYEATKVVIDRGKNKFNPDKVKEIVTDKQLQKQVLKKIEVVDADKLNSLVKLGLITDEQLDSMRQHQYTYSTKFKERNQVMAKILTAMNQSTSVNKQEVLVTNVTVPLANTKVKSY